MKEATFAVTLCHILCHILGFTPSDQGILSPNEKRQIPFDFQMQFVSCYTLKVQTI